MSEVTLLPYSIKSKSLGPANIQGKGFAQVGEHREVRIIAGHFRGCLPHHASREFCLFLFTVIFQEFIKYA